MKLSSIILLVMLLLIVTGMFASNLLLKKEYDKVDKADLYWTFAKISQQPFKHIKIEGGNITNIAFEQSKESSVRVFKNWDGYANGTVKASVTNDTLFVSIPNNYKDPYERDWLKWRTVVRIFTPQLLSVTGHDTNIELFKMQQKNLKVDLSGKSKVEMESLLYDLDSLQISAKDSSEVIFEMSSDMKNEKSVNQVNGSQLKAGTVVKTSNTVVTPPAVKRGWETMRVNYVQANLKDATLLDVGHGLVNNLQLNISDSAAIILSGASLKRLNKY